jgi:hypothetical protein
MTCRDWAAAANAFVALGEARATTALKAIAAKERDSWSLMPIRAGLLCRLLFIPRPGGALRQPLFGGLMLPYHSMPEASWPEYPFARQDSAWFLLSESYYLAGVAETLPHYLDYCLKAGTFRKAPLPMPTPAQARRALGDLLSSARWRALRWRYDGTNEHYDFSPIEVVTRLREQATF